MPLIRSKFNSWYVIPLIGLVVWWGMLIALISCWILQGRPIDPMVAIDNPLDTSNPVFVSDVGATNLQPLFISCTGFQAIFFAGTPILEHYLRSSYELQPYISTKQPWIVISSIVCAVIGQLGIVFASIFNTNSFHTVHMSMLCIFIVFIIFSCIFSCFNSYIFGWNISPDNEDVISRPHRRQVLYKISYCCKCIWLLGAISCGIGYGVYLYIYIVDLSARFEWILFFWYGLLPLIWAVDLFASAMKQENSSEKDPFATSLELNHSTGNDQEAISECGSFRRSP
ncbi:protein Sfk1p [[Candida] anglica]|uniref:Protein Sfk1p n=1 Tax=[Candida] anglica TaxID=148631 RepID=A0ABP0EIR6_9ASCO